MNRRTAAKPGPAWTAPGPVHAADGKGEDLAAVLAPAVLCESIIDLAGNPRVQYLGVHFDPTEFRRDLLGFLDETD